MAITMSVGQTKNLQASPKDALGAASAVLAASAEWTSVGKQRLTVTEDGGNQLLATVTALLPGEDAVVFSARDAADVGDVNGTLGVTVLDADHVEFFDVPSGDPSASPLQIAPGADKTIMIRAFDSQGFEPLPLTDFEWAPKSGGHLVFTDEETGGIAAPSTPTVTPQGTPGVVAYGYKIVGLSGALLPTEATAEGTTATGHAWPLDGTDFNRITWTGVAFTVLYEIWRTSGPAGASLGLIGTALFPAQFDDTGLPATRSLSEIPTANLTGSGPNRKLTGVAPGLDAILVSVRTPGGATITGELAVMTTGAVSATLAEV